MTGSTIDLSSVADPKSGAFWPLDPDPQTHAFQTLVTILWVKILYFFVNWLIFFSEPGPKLNKNFNFVKLTATKKVRQPLSFPPPLW
jgi:hypothetical protein